MASVAPGARAQTDWKRVANGPAAYRFAMATDWTQATAPRVLRYGGALPWPLPGAPGCWLLVSPDLVLPWPVVNGQAVLTVKVPATIQAGVRFYLQAGVATTVNSMGLATANGIEGTTGRK